MATIIGKVAGVRLGIKRTIGGGGVPAVPPVFTSQPAAYSLYQTGGRLQNSGAAASKVTRWQWQKKVSDTTWQNVAGQTSPAFDISSAPVGQAGTYRLQAFNGAAVAVSNEVVFYNVYLRIQNDASSADGSEAGTTKVNNMLYTEDGPTGQRYYSAFYASITGDTNFTPPGLSTARALVTWTSSNQNAVSTATVSASGQLQTVVRSGSATVVANIGNLSSTLNSTVA